MVATVSQQTPINFLPFLMRFCWMDGATNLGIVQSILPRSDKHPNSVIQLSIFGFSTNDVNTWSTRSVTSSGNS